MEDLYLSFCNSFSPNGFIQNCVFFVVVFLSENIRLDIYYKLSASKAIHMKRQAIFPWKDKKGTRKQNIYYCFDWAFSVDAMMMKISARILQHVYHYLRK